MKRKIILMLMAFVMIFSVGSCKKGNNQTSNTFGRFTYRGNALTSFSDESISYTTAKSLAFSPVQADEFSAPAIDESLAAISESQQDINNFRCSDEQFNYYVGGYGSFVLTSYFWSTDKNDKPKKVATESNVRGVDFQNSVKTNQVVIGTGITVLPLVLTTDVIESIEKANNDYVMSGRNDLGDFKQPYTYHRDSTSQRFVLRIHSFAQIASSVVGGTTCSFIQENEIIYNANGTIDKFQSSLGIEIQTSSGTSLEGTIFEVHFVWNEKK